MAFKLGIALKRWRNVSRRLQHLQVQAEAVLLGAQGVAAQVLAQAAAAAPPVGLHPARQQHIHRHRMVHRRAWQHAAGLQVAVAMVVAQEFNRPRCPGQSLKQRVGIGAAADQRGCKLGL